MKHPVVLGKIDIDTGKYVKKSIFYYIPRCFYSITRNILLAYCKINGKSIIV